MDSLIPEDDEETTRTLIPEDNADDAGDDAPVQSALPQSRKRLRLSRDSQRRLEAFADKVSSRSTSAKAAAAKPPKPPGLGGTIKEGAKSAARAIGATVDTYQGDEAEVVAAAKAQREAPKNPELENFNKAIEDHKARLGPDPSLWEGIKAVGSAAMDHPKGFGLMVAEQIPNSAVALGGGAAGALAGSLAGPVGAVVGGIAGLFGANTALETGHKAMEAAADGTFGAEEQDRVTREGTIKAAGVTAVDTLTLGATKFITGATARAMERATVKTLTDKGVDLTDAAAMMAARSNPEIVAQVQYAQKLAKEASDKLGKRIARAGGAVALETIGEGAGEYLGEFAATGKADVVDAVVESFAGLSQSMGEIAFTSALNKRAMSRLFGSKEEAEAAAKRDAKATGVEHEVKPHPTEDGKFVATPKTRSAQGVELEQDADGNLRPKEPESRQTDFNLANKPGFEHSAEDKIAQREQRRKNAEAYAKNPLILPGVDTPPAGTPEPPKGPTINGKDVTGLSNGTLLLSVSMGSSRAKKAAQDELDRRKTEGVDPAIANAVPTPAETVDHIIATGTEKAQEDGKKPDIVTPPPAPEKPVAPPATPEKPAPEAVKPEKVRPPVVPPKTPEAKAPSKQFKNYDAHINKLVSEQADFSTLKGVREQIAIDHRLEDGEPEALLKKWDAAATAKKEAPKTHKLPTHLAGAKPNYNYGPKRFTLNFESDIDRASYIAAQTTKSKRDDEYVKFVADSTGMSESEIRAHGAKVRQSIKDMAKDAEAGELTVADHGAKAQTPAAPVAAAAADEIHEHVKALIKRHAYAHGVLHRGKVFDKALLDAKALMAGEDVLPARFLSAADILSGDQTIVDILNALHVKATELQNAKKAINNAKKQADLLNSGQTPTTPPEKKDDTPAPEIEKERPAKTPEIPDAIQQLRDLGVRPEQIAQAKKELDAGDNTLVKDLLHIHQYAAYEKIIRDAKGDISSELIGTMMTDERIRESERVKLLEYGDKVRAENKPAKPEQTEAQKKKQADADAKKALATRKRVERDLHVLASTNPELMDMAGTMDLDSFTEGVNEAFTKEIARIANEYGGLEKEAVLELVKDGKAVLPKEFYSSAYAAAKLAYQEQKLIDARDPQIYREKLEAGLTARNIEQGGAEEAQYKDGFDHALKGKTRSTLPQGTKHGDGFDDARAWIKTEDGKAWFEGKRQSKQKSTGEALKRWWERAKKGLDGLTSKDMKKAWEQILRSTTRADLFPNLLADDATPGAKEWLDTFRSKVATFSEFYVREMIASAVSRSRYGTKAEDVFTGRATSYRGRAAELDWQDQDVTGETGSQRMDAKDAVVAIYEKMNKESAPDADTLAKQREVINDEGRWLELAHFASSNFGGTTYSHTYIISNYFQKITAQKKDKARLELSKQIAQEYQQHLATLAKRFDGLKDLAEIRAVIEEHYGKIGDYKLGSMEAGDVALYFDNDYDIKKLFPSDPARSGYHYTLWARLTDREEIENPAKARKDTLMRPRLDKIQRVMPDERKGRNITSAEFKKIFNVEDVTIGEYVTAKEAEDHLNYAHDALQSLALMLGAKPSQLFFGATMHFSIGALGHGKYAAHFSPNHPKKDGSTVPVINVTKTRGDGSVLHEYFHAIDYLTTDPALKAAIHSIKQLLVGTPQAPAKVEEIARNFLTGRQYVKGGGRMTRKEMALYALRNWYGAKGRNATVPTQFYTDAKALDEGAEKLYWSNAVEPWARASESWGLDRLKDSGQRDDYLQSDWAADGKVTKKTHRGTPYPTGEERKRLNALMEEFVNSIEWTDTGPRMKADHVWQKEPPFEAMMKPYADAVEKAIADIDKIEQAIKDEETQRAKEAREEIARRKAQQEKEEREALFGKPEEQAPPPPPAPEPAPAPQPEPPTTSSTPEGDAPLSEDELSAIFDDVAAAGNEASQEEPEAPVPGEKLDAQAWTTDDVFHLLNLVMQGRMILWSGEKFATELGLPTIQDVGRDHHGSVRHMGYGVFQVSTRDYKANWTGGGAMDHTPGGKAYTTLSVEEGVYPYPKDEVIRILQTVLRVVNEEKAAKKPDSGQKPDKKTAPLPDLKDEQDKTAGVLAAEFAKHGVKGIDKTLSGLVKLFGGGPNKLQSFPGGFDPETYAQAKVLFKEAAEEFRKSGLSFKEFVRVFFKALIDQFGNGVKPYAVKFAGEYQKTYEQVESDKPDEPEAVDAKDSPSSKLADWIYEKLAAKQAISWQELFAEGDKQFGGTQANGAYTPKDAYDAVELAINRYVIENKTADPRLMEKLGIAKIGMDRLENILSLVPTQTKRTAEMDEFQQFSTPPHFAFLANWAANLSQQDVYLEPSAGVGGLASFAKVAGVRQIIVNELSDRRVSLLQTLPFDRYFHENAEQIANILPDDVKPTVVVMNPPFSATAGRMEGSRDTMNGAKHIEQALKLLADGGRLVAIVGEGMAADRPAFKQWWAKIAKEYNVRANVGVSGASYAKYGTTFDNQLLVIDKNGPTTGEIVKGKVDHPADALTLLEGIRNDRPQAKTTDDTEDVASGTGRKGQAEGSGGGKTADTTQNPGDDSTSAVGGGGQRGGGGKGGGSGGRASGKGGNKSDGSGTATGESGRGGKDGDAPDAAGSKHGAGDSKGDSANGERNDSAVRLDSAKGDEAGAITNSVFEPYTPKKVRIEGAVPHNTPLVESAAMAAVSPPDPTYTPNLPKNVITKGLLSDAQLESVVYAGQAHEQFLRDGKTRRGFFLGDGTGVGKGRQISGVIMDNMRQGRKKAVWISKKKELIEDAKRDFGDLGGDPAMIFGQSKHKTNDVIAAKAGILFSAYPTLRSPSKAARDAQKKAGNQRKADKDGISFERIRQIVDWVGPDFDGVIVFDESHEMGNAVASSGARGGKATSDQAEAGLQLQAALPKARIMYVSATGATEVTNLGYAPRLGLWGEGTPFTNVNAFINAMSRSVSAMELVAQNLKQMGLYLARSLSFDGVTYEQLLHELTPFQRDVYDELAKGWQIVLNNMEQAMVITGQTKGGKDTGKIKSSMLSLFWSGHQRFFNQIITASQMPSIIEQIHTDLKDGKAVVLQLTNTDEAGQNRAIAKAAAEVKEDGAQEEEMDLSPIEQLTSLILKAYPTLQYQSVTDEDGNKHLRPVLDSKGNQVVNKEAVAARDALILDMKSMRIPDAPLQMLINEFGVDAIAEVTGRTQRLVKDEKGKYEIEKRGGNAVAADAQAFKDGKKNILVFSQAGGTGFSFHSDRRYKNRKKRAHYIMQAGWSADKAVQGFGRSHRTNQENEPVYRLVKTDIPGHKRFISSIARRLEQLGALTAGQRDTAGGSIFSAADNLESAYATHAVTQFFTKLISLRQFPEMPADLLEQLGLTNLKNPDTGGLVESKLPPVTRFLNRILSLRLDTQTLVFDAFMKEMELQIETARRLGTFDDGLATVRHVGADVKQETEVYRDPSTNADVRYIEIEYQTKNEFFEFDAAQKAIDYYNGKNPGSASWFKNKLSGRIAAVWATEQTVTLATGAIERLYGVYRTSGRSQEQLKAGNLERLTPEEARPLWEAENDKRPETHKHPLHMVVGGILPLWDRFNEEHVQVVRIAVDDGRRFLGRQIAQKDLADTLNKLDVQSSTAKMTGPQIVKAVMEGATVSMSNGWTLKKVRLSNDNRIEIDLGGKFLTMQAANQITDSGGIYERIGWASRYFIPTDEARGGKALAEIMQKTGSNAVAVKKADDEAPPPAAFSRAESAPAGLPRSQVFSIVKAIVSKWANAPEIHVVHDINDPDVPEQVRREFAEQNAQGAVGNVKGVFVGGHVYLMAAEMGSMRDAVEVLFHEVLGHFGLRNAFGRELEKVLKQVAALRRADVAAMAKRYGLDMNDETQRLQAAEEVLAHLAQTNPKNGFVQRAIAAIRKWLRENVPGFEKMKLSDGEIITHFIIPARQFVQRGRPTTAQGGLAGAFSRSAGQTSTAAFKKWFGDSKVVDEKGKPMVVYHGTRTDTDFSEFITPAHFGTKDQANSIVAGIRFGAPPAAQGDSERLMPVYLSIQDPVFFYDTGVQHDAFGYLEAVYEKGYLTHSEWESIQYDEETGDRSDEAEVMAKLIENLESRGYDGFAYDNQHEGEGASWVPFRPEQIKSATGNTGQFDGSNPDIRFSRSATAAAPAAPASSPLRDRMDKVVDNLIYNFQDRFKPLKDIQKRAGLVPEAEDAALAEERYSGMVRARTDEFEAGQRDPLIKAIHDSGVAYEDVEDYLHALHAPSRNAAMREINPTEQELKDKTDALASKRDALAIDPDVKEYVKLRRELRQAEADIEDGLADESLVRMVKGDIARLKKMASVTDYMDALDKLKALRLVKPFVGDNTALSGMSNDESKAILAKIDANGSRKALERISAIVESITSKTRQIYIDAGLEKAETIAAWNEKYDHYVPLHRDEVGGNTMPRIGQGFNIRGRESKRAVGSNREATNILAHVVAQHEAAIIRSEKSKVDAALFKFAQMHPDPALWTLDTAPMVRTVDAVSGLAVSRVDPTYKDRDEVLTLKIAGEEHTISFNERNEEGMRLAASMKNLSAQQLGEVTQMVGKVTRFLATMNTTANPVFIARNFMRDLQTAYVNLTDTALAGKKKEVFANVAPAIKGMWNLARGDRTSQWAVYAQEFRAAGGQTGWMEHYRDIGDRADTLKKELATMGPGKANATKRTLKSWWDIIGDANTAVENGVRLAAFVQARKDGLTEGKAAQLAKNLTVNFNARGAKSVELNSWYMFMNASIQGSARLIKAVSNKEVQKIVGYIVLSGFLMDVLARAFAGDDDDDGENDYDQLPEHVKSMNFVLWVDDRPVTIPMPYGYNFFASVGRKMSEIMFRENYSPVNSAVDLVSVFTGAFSPTGQAGSLLQYIAPTVADPAVQWAENRNFAGQPLRRPQSPFGTPNPEYQMGFRSTSAPAKWLAETLNDETGGNEVRPGFINMNPAMFDFGVTSVLGGAGRTALQTVSLPLKAGGDDEIEAREVPFANIFLSAKPEYQIERKYLDAVRRVELANEELQTYRGKGDKEMVAQIKEDHGDELKLVMFATHTKAVLNNLRKRELVLDKTDPENRVELKKAIDEKRRATMAKFNKRYREVTTAE